MIGKNLILANCVNYDLHQVRPFLISALKNVDSADIVLIGRDIGAELSAFIEGRGRIGMVEMDNAANDLHPQSGRYFSYLQYLCLDGLSYEKILLADIRDVVFQGDLFRSEWPSELILAAEDTRIKKEPYNQAWLQDMYGNLVCRFMANEIVSCSGTTAGSRRAILKYLMHMTAEILRQKRWTRRTGLGGMGYDQGIYNYLIWKGAIKEAFLDREHEFLSTVGCTGREQLSIEDDTLMRDGRAAPVLHQWDRHPLFAQHVQSLYL